jgi:hypothetical protein
VLISASVVCGHECMSHGPLFPAWEASDQRARPRDSRRWTLRNLLFEALLMVYDPSPSLQDRFANARQCVAEMFPQERRPGKTYQGFSKALRAALGKRPPTDKDPLQVYLRERHRRLAGRHWERYGWVALACDGSRVEVPRTAENEEAFGCAGREKTGPQLAVTTLYHMGTGLPWAWRIGPGTDAEREHLREMLRWLPAGALLVADAGFTGYDLLVEILHRGYSFLIRVGSNVRLLTGLGMDAKVEGDLVWLWPKDKRNQPPLKLRLIRVKNAKETGPDVYLITNVLDGERLPDATAAVLYRMRWGVEVFYRSYKQTLGQRKLRSGAPDQAMWELYWGMTALLLLGLMSVEGMIERGRDPLALSVAVALRAVRRAMRTSRRWRRRGDLRTVMEEAVKDAYRRQASKKARGWPHKKNDGPPGAPQIRPATSYEIRLASSTCEAA